MSDGKSDDFATPPMADSNEAKSVEMTPDEAKRLEECFRDKGFRDLLARYVDEISNPKTRLAYEEYLRTMEANNQNPQNRKLMTPIPAFCIKLRKRIDDNSEKKENSLKLFINCCYGDCVEDAQLKQETTTERPVDATGANGAGLCWRVPYILGHLRFEKDIHDKICEVYDIAFSANAMRAGNVDKTFRNIVIQTAIEAVENVSKHKFYPKYKILDNVKSRGEPALMSVYQQPNSKSKTQSSDKPQPPPKSEPKALRPSAKVKSESKITSNRNAVSTTGVESPQYSVVESGDITEIQNFWTDNSLPTDTLRRPKLLTVRIELPRLSKSSQIKTLNYTDDNTTLHLSAPSIYELQIKLNYSVNFAQMKAQWIMDTKQLKLVLPVKPLSKEEMQLLQSQYRKLQQTMASHNASNDELTTNIDSKSDSDSDTHSGNDESKSDPHNSQSNETIQTDTSPSSLTTSEHRQSVTEIVPIEFDDFRERLQSMVIKYDIPNIDAKSINIQFESQSITILFSVVTTSKTTTYRQTLELLRAIDPSNCKWNVNNENLLIMVRKVSSGIWGAVQLGSEDAYAVAVPSDATVDTSIESDDNREEIKTNADGKDAVIDALCSDVSMLELD